MSEIIMPKMGDAMTEGKVVQWYRKVGDPVKKGEPVLEIETDKVNLDLEAEESGVLEQILVDEGVMADVGAPLALIGDGTGSAKVSRRAPAEHPKEPRPKTAAASSSPARERAESPVAGERVRSSPLARKMARELGVDLVRVSGSGPSGRVIAADVKRAASTGGASFVAGPKVSMPSPAALEDRDVPLTAMRRTIARRLTESIGPVPHFFLTIETDVTELVSLRAQLNAIQPVKTSVNDFLIRAAALALHEHPNVNASFAGESIRFHGEVHIGVAVSTDEGLITPVVRNADAKSVPEIASAVKDLAERARTRRLRPDEYQGSTFTISNLGMFGIDEFTAIINPPNSAILAVGAAAAKPVVVDGQIVIRERMNVTMSCDHRVIDGAAGARFLESFRLRIEQPLRLVI